jgi:hypothetical protein
LETWKTTTATALKTNRIIFTTAVPGLYFWDGFVWDLREKDNGDSLKNTFTVRTVDAGKGFSFQGILFNR